MKRLVLLVVPIWLAMTVCASDGAAAAESTAGSGALQVTLQLDGATVRSGSTLAGRLTISNGTRGPTS